jgi:hypothetical protein
MGRPEVASRLEAVSRLWSIGVAARSYYCVQHHRVWIFNKAVSETRYEAHAVLVRSLKFCAARTKGARPMRMRFPGNGVEYESRVHFFRQP